jgi:hypothetical protein
MVRAGGRNQAKHHAKSGLSKVRSIWCPAYPSLPDLSGLIRGSRKYLRANISFTKIYHDMFERKMTFGPNELEEPMRFK